MAARAMTVTFRRLGRVCAWTALRPPRTVVPGPSMAAGGDLPHDLATFVIEDALDIEFGFWGCVAAGATFKTLGRKRTPQGKAVIAAHVADLEASETRANAIVAAWRDGRPTDVTAELDAMLARLGGIRRDKRRAFAGRNAGAYRQVQACQA